MYTVELHTVLCFPDNELSTFVGVDCEEKRDEVVPANAIPASGGQSCQCGDLRIIQPSDQSWRSLKACFLCCNIA